MEKLLFENKFEEEIVEAELVEAEPSHGGTNTGDIATTVPKLGFAKATLSKTLPAMIGHVQKINAPSGYIFAMRPQGANDTDGVDNLDPDNVETQGGVSTTINVTGALPYDQALDSMIVRKSIETAMREVKIITTNEVEQDISNLFGTDFKERYNDYLDNIERYRPMDTTSESDKLAKFFLDYGTTQMVKRTNNEFVTYLGTVAKPLGTMSLLATDDIASKLALALGQMQNTLMNGRNKVAGRFWVIASPDVAAILSTIGDIYSTGTEHVSKHPPTTDESTFVCSLGNMDVYMSPDLTAGKVYMGVLGNGNIASVYYTPYNEYMVHGGADAYSGQSNVFFRVRDAWATNPLDTFGGTQPTAGSNTDIAESATSDYIVSASITIPSVFV